MAVQRVLSDNFTYPALGRRTTCLLHIAQCVRWVSTKTRRLRPRALIVLLVSMRVLSGKAA
eukprot:COSAG06_NODE_47003_length_342_cov_1.267490_2_plen_60_part_01